MLRGTKNSRRAWAAPTVFVGDLRVASVRLRARPSRRIASPGRPCSINIASLLMADEQVLTGSHSWPMARAAVSPRCHASPPPRRPGLSESGANRRFAWSGHVFESEPGRGIEPRTCSLRVHGSSCAGGHAEMWSDLRRCVPCRLRDRRRRTDAWHTRGTRGGNKGPRLTSCVGSTWSTTARITSKLGHPRVQGLVRTVRRWEIELLASHITGGLTNARVDTR